MATQDLILHTKLQPPQIKGKILRRDRLLNLLKENLDKKLIFIWAGAGYGKTTLLMQLLNDLKMSFVFYHLEQTDADFTIFLNYIIDGTKKSCPGFGEKTRAVLSHLGSPFVDMKMVLGTFINEISMVVKNDLLLVLDDYHCLENSEPINTALEYLLEHQPRNLHLIISSRTKPPISTANLKAKQEMYLLNQNNLIFTKEETIRLFDRIYGIRTDYHEIEQIEKKSEGWVTGLQIFSQLLKDRNLAEVSDLIADFNPDFFDYFAAEIFLKQSPEIQNFLIKSSILDEVSPDVCNYVLEIQNSKDIIKTLIDKNLFIFILNELESQCRYHQLFRDFLKIKLKNLAPWEKIRSLHLKAASFFETRNFQERAINHYLQAEEYSKVMDIIEGVAEQWLAASRVDSIKRWIDNIPLSSIQERPLLLTYYAETLTWTGKWDTAMAIYKKARRIARRLGNRKSLALALSGMSHLLIWRMNYKMAIKFLKNVLRIVGNKDYLLKAMVLNAISAAYDYLGRYEKAFVAGRRALETAKKSGIHQLELKVFHDLNVCYFNLGKFEQALYGFQKIIESESKKLTPLLACTYTYYGRALRIKGVYQEAKRALEKALELQRFFNHQRGILVTIKELGYLYLWMEDYKQAQIYYEEALKLNMDMNITDINLEVLIGLIHLSLYQSDFVKAEENLNKIFLYKQAFNNPNLMVTKALFELTKGHWDKASKVLQRNLILSGKFKEHLSTMRTFYYLSVLYRNKKDERKWVYYLKKSFRLCKKNINYKYFLFQDVKHDPMLLTIALEKGVEPDIINFFFQEIDKSYGLNVKFFGALEIKRGREIIREKMWKTQKAKALFCYLVVHQKKKFIPFRDKSLTGFTRDKLIEIFWPNTTLSAGRSNLRSAIGFIRETVGDASILYEKETYSINPDWKIWVDCKEFEKLLKIGQTLKQKGDEQTALAKYESALTLYQGDFLPEIYDNWAEDLRQFYREKYLEMLSNLANYNFMKGNLKEVIDHCEKIIETDKFREEAYGLLIKSYIKIRKRRKALNIYEQLSKLLKENFQSEPSFEIKKLFEI